MSFIYQETSLKNFGYTKCRVKGIKNYQRFIRDPEKESGRSKTRKILRLVFPATTLKRAQRFGDGTAR